MQHSNSFAKKISYFIALGFGSGLSPKAPGTCGTIIILVLSYLFLISFGSPNIELRVLFCLIACILNILCVNAIIGDYPEGSGNDPQEIVIDEFAGFLMTMTFLPWSATSLIMGFILFRIFDITKPPPISYLENAPGSYGILLDDIGAGIIAGLLLLLISSQISI